MPAAFVIPDSVPGGLLLAQNVMPHLMGHLLFDEFIFIFSL